MRTYIAYHHQKRESESDWGKFPKSGSERTARLIPGIVMAQLITDENE